METTNGTSKLKFPKISRKAVIITLIITNILAFLFATFFFLIALGLKVRYSNLYKQWPNVGSGEIRNTNLMSTEDQAKVEPKKWRFTKEVNNETKYFLEVCDGCKVVKWKNYLIYSTGYYHSDPIEVRMYNLETDEVKVVYALNDHLADFGDGNAIPNELSDLKVLGNTLYFSLGGYLITGATYWVNLENPEDINLLAEGSNANIYFSKNKTWLVSGEGDSCWGSGFYSVIDTTTMKLGQIVKYNIGCSEGDQIIGADRNNNLILGFHTPIDFQTNDEDNGSFKYIELAPIDNFASRTKIITEAEMPGGITEVLYSEPENQIWLLGLENYYFDMSENKLYKAEAGRLIPSGTGIFDETQYKKWNESLKLPHGFSFFLS